MASEPGDAAPAGAEARGPNAEGVEALLAVATDAVADERERGRTLDQKAASITALVGVTLSLNATLGRPLLDADLGPVGDRVVQVGFLVATIGLCAAALFAVFAVFRPQKYRGLGKEQIDAFTEPVMQQVTKLEVHQRMLGALSKINEQEKPINDSKARALKRAAVLIGAGLLGVAAEALTLGLRQMGA